MRFTPAHFPFLFSFSLAALATQGARGNVTFARDIAPIVFQNCTGCHRPGEAAPFSLTNYAETKKRAKLISEVTRDRYMPPWQPDEGCGEFVGERRLTKAQVDLFRQWVEAGTPEGDAALTPPLPKFPEGWQHGTPDMVVTMEASFIVPASGPDVYRNFVIPLNLSEDKWVQSIEIRPSSRGALHHVLLFLDSTGAARKLDESDPGPGFKKMGFPRTGALGGWAVGGGPRTLPDGLALPLPRKADLVLSSHFHPTGKEEQEHTTIGLYFAKQKPDRLIVPLSLPALFARGAGLDIPAGDANYTLKDTLTLPVDTDLVTVGAHAHYLGKRMEATATLPDGTKKTLFRISDWDFNWQDQYVYRQPVRLPAGTRIDAEIAWDNSGNNPHNPLSPPRRVTWGEETVNEMGSIGLGAVAVAVRDHDKLAGLSRDRMKEVFVAVVKESGANLLAAGKLRDWAKLDTNHDHVLSGDEIPDDVRHSRLMNLLDKNGDEQLDAAELEHIQDALRPFANR